MRPPKMVDDNPNLRQIMLKPTPHVKPPPCSLALLVHVDHENV